MAREDEDACVVPIVEETLRIDKRAVETGRIRVSLKTEEIEETIRETLRTRRAEIERRPVGEIVTEVPRIRQEGDIVIIPVVEEVLVVEKRLVLREEIRLHLTETTEDYQHRATRRVQNAAVERVPPVRAEP